MSLDITGVSGKELLLFSDKLFLRNLQYKRSNFCLFFADDNTDEIYYHLNPAENIQFINAIQNSDVNITTAASVTLTWQLETASSNWSLATVTNPNDAIRYVSDELFNRKYIMSFTCNYRCTGTGPATLQIGFQKDSNAEFDIAMQGTSSSSSDLQTLSFSSIITVNPAPPGDTFQVLAKCLTNNITLDATPITIDTKNFNSPAYTCVFAQI